MKTQVKLVIFAIVGNDLKILLLKNGADYRLPNHVIKSGNKFKSIIKNKLVKHIGIKNAYIEQLYTFDSLEEVQVSYLSVIDSTRIRLSPDFYPEFFSVNDLPKMGRDDVKIINYGLTRLRYKIEYTSIGMKLLPLYFSMSELRKTYEIILGEQLDRRNFSKKVKKMNIVEETDKVKSGAHRPAKLYKMKEFESRSKFKRVKFEG